MKSKNNGELFIDNRTTKGTPMFFRRCLFAIAIVVPFLTALALNQPAVLAQQPQNQPQVPLTRDNITRFLAIYPELKALAKKYKKETLNLGEIGTNSLDSLWAQLQHGADCPKAKCTINAHGFSSYQELANVGRSIGLAYGFAKSGDSLQQTLGEADKALASIRANPNFSDAEKQQREAMITQQLDALKQILPSAENLAITKEMFNEIAAVLKRE